LIVGLTLLCVPGLVGLDRRDQRAEVEVAGLHRVCGHAEELQVGEAGLEGERELDRHRYGVVRQEHVVEEVASGDDAPLVGVVGLVRPVELRLLGQGLVRDVRLQLTMTGLIESAEGRHVAPGRGAAEAGHAGLADAGLVLRDRDGAVVRDDGRTPAGLELVPDVGAVEDVVDGVHAGVLAGLVVHVLRVGDFVRLVPCPPVVGRHTEAVRQFRRESLVLRDVGQVPVHVTREVVPLRAG
jgi:hypothetical protein